MASKQATNIDEQIALLKSRGLIINDEEKAKENLLDIGYYRLGFYLFPFEETYPNLRNRDHKYIPTATFEDAVALYYFDYDLRNILNKYITRIEVALRTRIIYEISNKYRTKPKWFANRKVMTKSFVNSFDSEVYTPTFKRNFAIKQHHDLHSTDKYAPAWKTIEFMTFGTIVVLYKNLRLVDDKRLISNAFNVGQTAVFENYIDTVRTVRNRCAHGTVLFDMNLPVGVRKGPAGKFTGANRQKLVVALQVIKYMLSQVSANRLADMEDEIKKAIDRLLSKNPKFEDILRKCTGFDSF